MSIVIQKKRLNKKAPADYAQKVSAFEKRDPLHEKYFEFFTDFETEFKKTIGQTSLRNLRITLDAFYKSLKTDEFLLTDLSKQADSISNKNENTFLVNRATDIVNLLSDYVVDRRNLLPFNRRTWDPLDRQSCDTKEITLLCVKILKLFCIVNLQFSLQLSNNAKFCSRMFSLLLQDNKMYFKQILSIIESLIASNPEVMKPAIYPFMQDVLTNMSKKHFARFSRIIALFVLESNDKMDFKELSINYSDNKMIKIHSFLLSVPDLIETYTIILEHLTKITETLISTTTQNLSKTSKFLIESNLIKDSGLNLGFLKPLFGQCDISENLAAEVFCPKFIVKFMVKKSNLTEILFIISNLLQSKRKFEVQGILRQINFLERALIPLLDYLFHDDLNNDTTNDPFYSEDVGCTSPLATTRIQLLRIFISFCDRDTQNISNKELLISPEEKNILYSQLIHGGLAAHHPTYTETEGSSKRSEKASRLIGQISVDCKDPAKPFFTEQVLKNNAFASVQKKGLLSKIISLFDKFSPDSNYRFWLASCVESFLRGFHEPHQIFVAHSGLLYTLMNEILNKGITKQTNIQISYDLIGEIIKFNKYNMVFLEKMCEKFNWMDKLAEGALTNVIDSNVFLRALFLSFERFNFASKTGVSFNEHSRVFRTFATEAPKLFYMISEALDPNEINQDNICCVNTILIMAILAEQKGELDKYIDLLATDKADDRDLLKEFNEVLSIWYRYYMSKTKDCYSLEFTTGIPFFYYQDMKNTLQNILEKRASRM